MAAAKKPKNAANAEIKEKPCSISILQINRGNCYQELKRYSNEVVPQGKLYLHFKVLALNGEPAVCYWFRQNRDFS